MLLNTKNLLFKSYSSSKKKSENSFLSEKITNNNLNLLTDNFQHSRLNAKWEMEDGKLVCKWFMT
ncbi:hypothetical protein NIES4073_36740 [Kalymmatonema gypsitolerans NIES-4073]|nr:hypothetical protein NIES4073_36740 [Scytonema sp. NIES-4073]